MGNVENWKQVVGWEDLYEVSDLSRVRSLDRWVERGHTGPYLLKSKVLKTQVHRQGYSVVTLSRDGFKRTVKVHRLVADAFIDNPEGHPLVLHGSNGITDNRPENLRWGTHSDNNYDTVRDGNHPQASKETCPQGHAYSGVNSAGSRVCRQCQAQAVRKNRSKMKWLS